MKKILLFTFAFLTQLMSYAQISVNTTASPQDLVNNTLIGAGVVVSNITYTGEVAQRGYFNAGTSNIGLPEGVLLSSGNVVDCVPPNLPSNGQFGNPGDPDLLTVAQSVTSNPDADLIISTNDAAILEFDFVPSGDSVTFNFVFASVEYDGYINSQWNDAFGFFVSGPGITGPFASPPAFPNGSINLALVPGTSDPITISTIYSDPFETPTEMNAAYYIGTPSGHSFYGFTVPIEIGFEVICGETYHFKFAVADCQDDFLDTGVFLEAGSFSSNSITLESQSSATGAFTDTLLAENCVTNTLTFTRPIDQIGVGDTIPLILSGTVDLDLDLLSYIDTVFFLPGEESVSFEINPIDDGLAEPIESFEIGFYNITQCGDSIYDSIVLYITDFYPTTFNLVDTILNNCIFTSDQVEVTDFDNSIPPFSVQWTSISNTTDNPVTLPPFVNEGDTITHYVTVFDGCNDPFYDSVVYINTPLVLTYNLVDTVFGNCLANVDSIEVTNFGVAEPPYSVEWSFSSVNNPEQLPIITSNQTGEMHYVTITDGCGYEYLDSVYYQMNQTLSIDTILSGPATCDPTGWVNASVSGYTEPINVDFDWTNQGDTNIVYPNQSVLTDLGGGWYILTFTDENIGCSVVDSAFVETTNLPQAIASVTPNNGCAPLSVVFSNDSENANSYTWDFGNGNVVTTSSMADISQVYTANATISLTASNGNPNCDNTTQLFIEILPCGCIDPLATNYNPQAVYDDGSCIFPTPIVTAPNVFTPNGDFDNPVFVLETQFATNITFTILNRWGNLIYSGSGTEDFPPVWNGKTQAGIDVEEGVYFYTYVVQGYLDSEVEGHGFVQVVR